MLLASNNFYILNIREHTHTTHTPFASSYYSKNRDHQTKELQPTIITYETSKATRDSCVRNLGAGDIWVLSLCCRADVLVTIHSDSVQISMEEVIRAQRIVAQRDHLLDKE